MILRNKTPSTLANASGWCVIALCLINGGCAALGEHFSHPGTAEQQRLRATIHDPYPDPDLGPKVEGGRPRDYLNPLPEPVRNRIYVDSMWGVRRQ